MNEADGESAVRRALAEAERLDLAAYAAIAACPTPTLDVFMSRLSRAADYSKLHLTAAALLAAAFGREGREAAWRGLASTATTAAVLNLFLKRVGRRRPDRAAVPLARQVRMPRSTSFPSGHAAAAFAFSTAVGHRLPRVAIPLHAMAALVAYSRVHTGVHYPADAIAGAVVGTALGQVSAAAAGR